MLVREETERARQREKGRKINHNQIIRERSEERERERECERILSKGWESEVGRQICLHLLSTLATSLVAIINNCFHPSVGGNGNTTT